MLSAVHIINRMPLQVLGLQSPYEKLFNEPVNVDHFKVFGCLCYVTAPSSHRTKFDVKVVPHAFIGYPTATKEYKVLILYAHTTYCIQRCSFL